MYGKFNYIQETFRDGLDNWPDDKDICMHYLRDINVWWS